jgi:Na+/phosphate symporter
MTKHQTRIANKTPITKQEFRINSSLSNLFLVIITLAFLLNLPAFAMGSAPPKEEKPKYKLEILKMELVTQPTTTAEVAPVQKSPEKKK